MNKKIIAVVAVVSLAIIISVLVLSSITQTSQKPQELPQEQITNIIFGYSNSKVIAVYFTPNIISTATVNGTTVTFSSELKINETTFNVLLYYDWEYSNSYTVTLTFNNLQNATATARAIQQFPTAPTPTATPQPTPSPSPIGFIGNSEQASITNVVLTNEASGENAQVTIQNTGSLTVTITSAYIDSTSASMYLSSGAATTSIPIVNGGTATFNVTVSSATFVNTAQYTIKLMTAKGNTLTSTATYTGLN